MTTSSSEGTFLFRELAALNKTVLRLGLGFKYGIDGAGVEAAIGAGVNLLLCAQIDDGEQREVVRSALKKDREHFVLAAGPDFGYFAGSIRRGTERLLRSFDVEYLDVLMLYWLGRRSRFSKGVEKEMVALREQGLVRTIGTSIHDRKRAAQLAVNSPLDLFMLRYNAAHPGAEREVFPQFAKRRPMSVAYTATSWCQLLRAPRAWKGAPMTAGDCYRFCLSSPHVDAVLCGARSGDEVLSNLEALRVRGALTTEEDSRFREFGRLVHG